MKIRIVGGDIREYTGGGYTIYSKGDIIESAGGIMTETAPEIIYGDVEPHPHMGGIIRLAYVKFRTLERFDYKGDFGFDWLREEDNGLTWEKPYKEIIESGVC